MWFKNLQIYRLPANWGITLEQFEAQLAKKPFHPCASQDMESRGWLSPLGNEALVHAVGGQWLVTLGFEHRLLPSAVVKQEADERAEELAEQQGYKLGRKQMKELREQITQELLPRAFTRRRRLFAWIDPVNGWLVVDAASQSKAEDLIEQLRHSLDHFPLALLRTERSPMSAMADWLAGGEAPAGFTIDQDCELRSIAEDKAAVRYVRHPLEGDEVKGHLEAGKLPTRLALTFDDRISFVLTEKLEIKRLDFLDIVRDQLGEADKDDAEALFNAEFALMTGELSHLLPAVVDALGGEIGGEASSVSTPDPAPALATADDPPF
ncbi:recombination-associated protein RdgC [Thauera chlorobenzoica]|uniref:Recombination-associated protein RdgC n=1 Tax=Thauera chlorobenzoica TaxID=96773 RepID=A0A1H5V850_9RHOO|nr:recombination-associated protein RdgC [Thauera chlorobenzoica]APR02925.1 DNA recombination-dependent growth factor C [Thauera chlorobenzoica]SEF83383.1 recombination associated protein RdgC [Thauera chlorobenzoica]